MNEDPGRAELGPGLAATSALAAGFAHQVIAWTLASAFGASEAVYALGALLAYAASFALLAPRLPGPPAQHLGLVRPSAASLVAAGLLLASVLLISEIDNLVRALLPWPEAVAKAVEQARAEAGETSLADGLQLVLVYVVALPLVLALFYRGLLQPILAQRFGSARGVLLTAALEATAPFANLLFLWAWPVVAARAAILGALRQCSGSLLPALLLDAAMGAVQTAAHFELFGIPGFDAGGGHTPAAWLLAAALPTALGLGLCRRLAREGQR